MPEKTLIIGCGYIGLPLAWREHARGNEVSVWVHSQASAEALRHQPFRQIVVGSVADGTLWQKQGAYDRIVHCASSGRGGVEAYDEVFLEGARRLIEYQPQARRLFVSSTSVYGQTQGELVTEESPAEPCTETGAILRESEKILLETGALVVRSSGIYGPQRGVLFEKFRRGEAIIEGDGSRWMNQIHRDDLVAAVVHILEKGVPGEIYNASDDLPVTHRDFYAWCADFLHRPMPPYGPINLQRKRGLTNKRVSNAKLRALGWQPRYPSFREGYAASG